jgi:hypothetical protein
MSRGRSPLIVAALMVLSAWSAASREPSRPRVTINNTEVGSITTTVTSVDFGARMVTLTGPRGNRVTLPVGPDVANLDRVRAGDSVATSFVLKQRITVVRENAPRARPGAFPADTTEFASEVTAVDDQGRGLWLRGPAGGTFRVAIAPEVPDLDQVRSGDKVIYRETTVLTAFAGGPLPDQAKVGMLQCAISPSIGLIVGSHQTLDCRFLPDNGGPIERYAGSVDHLGLDIGITTGGQLAWAVYAPNAGLRAGVLAGTYVGASGHISTGIGVGANVLVGGTGQTAALQPLSVEGQFGANLALGIASLSLRPAP